MPDEFQNRRIPYFGDFVLFDEIGRGGMGVVYNAQQTKLDRPVALKVLHSSFAGDGAVRQRFRLEAEAAARLEHPNIVPIFEIGEHEGHPYLAMQLIEGESLAEKIARLGASLQENDAAVLIAKISRAVHHAHQRGVLHRDLKPGNILIDESGEPHLIDFGLAKCVELDSGLTQTGAFLGTPAYASPEQAAGQNKSITTASDIYSLGAILYALLTGQPPFTGESTGETIEKVKNSVPLRPRSVRATLSANLETICLKCLEKEPVRRYASALEFAGDLECFLDGRPIMARPVGSVERLWLWTRRNPAQAALVVIVTFGILASVVGGFLWRNVRVKETEARSHILQREVLLGEVQAARLTAHSAGWSHQAWSRASNAARIPTTVNSDGVRDQAAALLAGLDAYLIKQFTAFGASSVTFDREGKRLLMGGLGDGAKLWDAATDTLQISSRTGLGPVAFAENGASLQLLYDGDRHSLVLAGVPDSQTVREWKIPPQIGSESVSKKAPKFAVLTPDGASVYAVFKGSDGHEVLAIFLSDAVRLVESLSNSVTAVTISSDGSLVAAAESTGKVNVWSVRDERRIAEFTASRNKIVSLALKHTARAFESRVRGTSGFWLLAVGDSGGLVTLWDLHTRTVSAFCRGGHYHVYAVAFSPDGMTLASGGRGPVKLWEVATGRLLLDVPTGDGITGLDFAPDGTRLAVSTRMNAYPANVSIWSLEFGRGIKTLRGLSGEVSKICFSADGRRFAALSHRWEVGVWDLVAGRLLQILEVPEGEFADNVALALSPDGKRLAFSASKAARMWEVQSGVELGAWELPPGLVDTLGFPDENHLLLFRMETLDGQRAPFSDASPKEHPRVCRIRDLLSQDARKPVAEIRDFNWHVFAARAPHDGRTFVAEGIRVRGGERTIMIKSFDGLTGKERWTIPLTRNYEAAGLVTDATGKLVAFRKDHSIKTSLVELASGEALKTLDFVPTAMRAEPRLYAVGGYRSGHGVSLFDDTSMTPLITLGIDATASNFVEFDPRGDQLAWGNADGTVTVCNLEEIRDRLSRAGLRGKHRIDYENKRAIRE